ncbi:FAD-binding oxidoreductase [Bradyrhizobium sp. CB3481]|uniref:FAD-binding oxidoreductase n=1 Tax=Bradyrhizobium sp. CB3481 TaxID=3039158 RepID=UPI0024B1A759|nr:FAD-binding oxidoreductase [Bradyrhizobium sp. CB3481]WFU18779.1 FAD-binding oxidoreductase [Bradyrhizobium sp. CB3481]
MPIVHGWGRYPVVEAEIRSPVDPPGIAAAVKSRARPVIPRGMGRSYGDSALSDQIIDCCGLNGVSAFDFEAGLIRCGAGVTLSDLLTHSVPKGWFLPVTPGTKFVTIAGAIASDVHGKNHHLEGCFSEFVESFDLMLAGNEILTCSRHQHVDLFHATVGGMGLTGIILEATLRLKPISSTVVEQITFKARNLQEALHLFDAHEASAYSVAWIDCMVTGPAMGRALLMLGEHSEFGGLSLPDKRRISVPFDVPTQTLNRFSIKAFNWLYYHRIRQARSSQRVDCESFFYPLDGIHGWNRLYGKRGFLQYQFVVPKHAGLEGLTALLKQIVESRRGSFLAVLKLLGRANQNLLSFPIEGYTLSVDFKLEDGLFELLNELDAVVLDYGGRIYLAKDARMKEATFKRSYPRWMQFQEVRSRYGALATFSSRQAQRIGLD